MVIDIKGLDPRQTTGARQGEAGAVRADQRAGAARPDADAAARDDTVELSELSELIRSEAARLSTQAPVDEARVRDIRNAIASGDYQIDSLNVARKLIEADNS